MKTTFSIIKADVGGWPGHALVHPDLKEIANIKQQFTQYGGARPFGVSMMLGGINDGKPQLFTSDVTGNYFEFRNATNENRLYILIISLTTGSGAIFVYYYGLRRVKAIIATISELLFPISAILFDYLINDSVLSSTQLISAAIMVFAIIQLNRK